MLRVVNITKDEFAAFKGNLFVKASTEVNPDKDIVMIQEVDDEKRQPTGTQSFFTITKIIEPSRTNGIKKGYVIADLKRIKNPFAELLKAKEDETVEEKES